MEECSNLGAMVPLTTIEKKEMAKVEENKENARKQEQPVEEGNSLTEKAKEVLSTAAEKTKEIVHNVKEKLNNAVNGEETEKIDADVGENTRPEQDFDFIRDKPELGENEDIFARKEEETRRKLNDEQLRQNIENKAREFSKTDELHAEQAQNIALQHAKQD